MLVPTLLDGFVSLLCLLPKACPQPRVLLAFPQAETWKRVASPAAHHVGFMGQRAEQLGTPPLQDTGVCGLRACPAGG